MFDRQALAMFYRKAESAADLPWHRNEPDRFLVEALDARKRPGRALDLGCGAGVFSVYMAKRGYAVTGIDIMPRALDMAQRAAEAAGVRVEWVRADIFAWTAADRYDVVLDSGCRHSLIGGSPARYKQRLLQWLAADGDFILGHWGKKHALDWLPVGPRRRSRQALARFLAPELAEVDYEQELMRGIPFPFGPMVLGQSLWFRRA
jgi:SAM-dependent methyltransferase